jgi:hypothetical protein
MNFSVHPGGFAFAGTISGNDVWSSAAVAGKRRAGGAPLGI